MINIIKNSKFLRYYLWMPESRNARKMNSYFFKIFNLIVLFPKAVFRYLSFFAKIDEPKDFKYRVAIVAIVKNEGPYIKEWIEYHHSIGIEKFYIYDNDSTDDLVITLKPYIKSGIVDLVNYPGNNLQCYAYNDAIEKHRYECEFIGAIDLDEFILPLGTCNISDVTNLIKNTPNAGGIGLHWCCYGSSGHKTKPNGMVIKNYLYRAKDDYKNHVAVKTICNPRLVIAYSNPHFPIYRHGYFNTNENGHFFSGACDKEICFAKVRINHYFCKSEEECRKKINRGKADIDGKYSWNQFLEYDRNEIYDDAILHIFENNNYIESIN